MTKEQIYQMFEEYGISTECANDKNDSSWSDFIHYPTHRESILSYYAAPDYFDFIRYMRAECIKNAVFFVPMTSAKEFYKSYEHESGPVHCAPQRKKSSWRMKNTECLPLNSVKKKT